MASVNGSQSDLNSKTESKGVKLSPISGADEAQKLKYDIVNRKLHDNYIQYSQELKLQKDLSSHVFFLPNSSSNDKSMVHKENGVKNITTQIILKKQYHLNLAAKKWDGSKEKIPTAVTNYIAGSQS